MSNPLRTPQKTYPTVMASILLSLAICRTSIAQDNTVTYEMRRLNGIDQITSVLATPSLPAPSLDFSFPYGIQSAQRIVGLVSHTGSSQTIGILIIDLNERDPGFRLLSTSGFAQPFQWPYRRQPKIDISVAQQLCSDGNLVFQGSFGAPVPIYTVVSSDGNVLKWSFIGKNSDRIDLIAAVGAKEYIETSRQVRHDIDGGLRVIVGEKFASYPPMSKLGPKTIALATGLDRRLIMFTSGRNGWKIFDPSRSVSEQILASSHSMPSISQMRHVRTLYSSAEEPCHFFISNDQLIRISFTKELAVVFQACDCPSPIVDDVGVHYCSGRVYMLMEDEENLDAFHIYSVTTDIEGDLEPRHEASFVDLIGVYPFFIDDKVVRYTADVKSGALAIGETSWKSRSDFTIGDDDHWKVLLNDPDVE